MSEFRRKELLVAKRTLQAKIWKLLADFESNTGATVYDLTLEEDPFNGDKKCKPKVFAKVDI